MLTSARKFAESIQSGVAAAEDCYVQSDISATRAGAELDRRLESLAAATGLGLHQQYGRIVNMWWGACESSGTRPRVWGSPWNRTETR